MRPDTRGVGPKDPDGLVKGLHDAVKSKPYAVCERIPTFTHVG